MEKGKSCVVAELEITSVEVCIGTKDAARFSNKLPQINRPDGSR